MIDTHTHIFYNKFDQDRAKSISRSLQSGVQKMILAATDSTTHGRLIETVKKFPEVCYGTIGLHPTTVNDNPNWSREIEIVEKYLKNPPIKWHAVGEVGIDLHWSQKFLKEQTEAFQRQIELSIEYDLPLIIHARKSWSEIFATMKPYLGRIRGVFHSFNGEYYHLKEIERMDGFYIGISGMITYPTSNLPSVLRDFPLERILLETDAPYLPPDPHRGKRNESSYMLFTARKLAQVKGVSIEEVKRITTQGAEKLFFGKK